MFYATCSNHTAVHFMALFYGCIIPMDLKKIVRSGIRIFEKYFNYLISHIDGC